MAGEYFQDFSAFAPGVSSFGDGSQLMSTQLGSVASVVDGTYKELQLTASGVVATTSAFELPDLDPGAPVYGFSAKWNVAVYGAFPGAGDGFSLNFGQLASVNLLGGAVEAGYGTGLCLSVQTAGANPGFYLSVNSNLLASVPYNASTQWGINNGTRHLFEVDWNYFSGMTVRVDGQTIFSNVPSTGFTPHSGDRLVWAARSVNYSEYLRLDNIVVMTGGNLVTVPASSPYFADANSYYLHPGTNAFDGNTNTYWLENATTGYAGATINSPVSVYALTSLHDSGGAVDDPQAWELDGSNDGATWTALGYGSGYFLNHRETRCWMTSNTNRFIDCRLNVTANNGGPNLKLYDVTLYQFQAQQGPPVASLNYQPASATPFGTVLTATIPTSYGNKVTLNWGTNTSYGNTVTFLLSNSFAPQTTTYAVPPVKLAIPIHYQFTYQYGSAPGTNDIVGADAVVQPAGFSAVTVAVPLGNGMSGFVEPVQYPPAGWQNVPLIPLMVVADSLVFLDSGNNGRLDLLATGDTYDLALNSLTDMIFENTNSPGSGTTFTQYKTATANSGQDGGYFNGYSAVFDYLNNNQPAWLLGGDCVQTEPFYVAPGNNQGDAIGLPWMLGGSLQNNYSHSLQGILIGQNIAGPGRGVAADFDQDGFDDFLLINQNGGLGFGGVSAFYTFTPSTFLLRSIPNTGQSTAQVWPGQNAPRLFTPVPNALPVTGSVLTEDGQSFGSTLAVGDVNHDGYPDVFIAMQQSDGTFVARFYLNQSGKSFVPGPDTFPMGGLFQGGLFVYPSAVLADFNGDGNLDLLLAGWGEFTRATTTLYYGDGTGHFTNSNIVLPQRSFASVAVGDFFNHGRTDILLGGYPGNSYPSPLEMDPYLPGGGTLLLRNDGGSFTSFDFGLPNAYGTTGRTIAVADVDNDGKLDFAAGDQEGFAGLDSLPYGYPLAVYRNVMNIPTNAPPSAPTNLVSQVGSGTVTLHWGNASDDITPPNLLTYNLRIGTNTLGTDKVSPLANPTTGWRKVVAPGNRGHNFQCTYHLSPGTYYWSVQAVDGAFAGGAWAPEQSFTVTNAGAPLVGIVTAANTAMLSWPGWAAAYTLQSRASLNGGAWVNETNLAPYHTMSGFAADVPMTQPARFYRLTSP